MQSATARIFGLITLLFSSLLLAGEGDWGIKPNIGFDVNLRNQPFETSFGMEQFHNHYPDTNLYIGTKIHKYVGIVAGYEHMYRQEQKQFYEAGNPVLGALLVGGNRFYLSDVSMHGWHLDLEGFWPICPRIKTELTATLGIAWLKMYYDTALFEDPVNPANPMAFWTSDDRAMLRFGFGIRQMITKHFGTRLQAIWENTEKLEGTTPVPFGQGGALDPVSITDNYSTRPRNSFVIGLGFFLQAT